LKGQSDLVEKILLYLLSNKYGNRLGKYLFHQPNFFLIGAMKSGTTSLYQYLSYHSLIKGPTIKEPCYYSYNYSKGLFWYLSKFPLRWPYGKNRLFFDPSPVYLHDPLAPERICKDYPDAKLIIILRDPIERAISHYNY